MKTLQQVEPRIPISSLPFNITQPGSYYLTGDLTSAAGFDGIWVNSSDVSIDLMGYTLRGVPGSGSGITTTGGGGLFAGNIIIRNGRITGWGGWGVLDPSFSIFMGAVTFEDLRVYGNAQGGLSCRNQCRVVDCELHDNGGISISVGSQSVVLNNVISTSSSNAVGIFARSSLGFPNNPGSRVEGNHIHVASGVGIMAETSGHNLIVRNSIRAQTALNVSAGNTVGPLTSDPVTAGPWANFDLNTVP